MSADIELPEDGVKCPSCGDVDSLIIEGDKISCTSCDFEGVRT